MVNRYPGKCSVCSNTVPAFGGQAQRVGSHWAVTHLACASGAPQVIEVYSPMSGKTWTRNARGLCEDAPCCGCCTG